MSKNSVIFAPYFMLRAAGCLGCPQSVGIIR